jgi:hypothetical protein
MLLEITSPVCVFREPRVSDAGSGGGLGSDWSSCSAINLLFLTLFRALREGCFNPGYVAPEQAQPTWLFELAALLLQTQMQTLLAQVASLRQQLVRAQLRNFFHFHGSSGGGNMMPAQKLRAHR